MSLYYSIAWRGFVNDDMRDAYEASADGWPADAVMVTKEEEDAIREALSQSATITLNEDGTWAFIPYVQPESERIAQNDRQKSSLQSLANTQIDILTDATDPDIVDAPTDEDVALLLLWKKYRQALRTVVTSANPVVWPKQPAMASGTNLST